MIQIIEKKQKVQKDLRLVKLEAFTRFLNQHNCQDLEELEKENGLEKFIYLGVNHICTLSEDFSKELSTDIIIMEFTYSEELLKAMGRLTPIRFQQLFPIEKRYDGARYDIKDYFYTKELMDKLPENQPIGNFETMFHLLWNYQNLNLEEFLLQYMALISFLWQLQGGQDPLVEFLHKERVPTYTCHEKEGYISNNLTGEVIKLKKAKKRRPKSLKVVK